MQSNLKKEVNHYWNKASCGTEHTNQEKFSQHYFQDIENHRYAIEPEIFSFAQFSRFHKKTVLEVGVGAGTDFIQWVRSGAYAYGIDLTAEAIKNIQARLTVENLQATDLQVADAEHLPYENDFFDLVYSWGVIHHSPDTVKCFEEIIRVTKPGGTIKIMVYNRYSLFALYRWFLAGLLKGKPFQSLSKILFYHQESLGTKAYTRSEIVTIMHSYPVVIKKIEAVVTQHDLLYYKPLFFRAIVYILACIGGWRRVGWFMTIELQKKNI